MVRSVGFIQTSSLESQGSATEKTLRHSFDPMPSLHKCSHIARSLTFFSPSGHNKDKGRSESTQQARLCKRSKIPGRPIDIKQVQRTGKTESGAGTPCHWELGSEKMSGWKQMAKIQVGWSVLVSRFKQWCVCMYVCVCGLGRVVFN